MIAVLLAAGMAKRLRPLTDTVPKCLLKIGEQTLLARTIDALTSKGVTHFVVVTGYRSAQIDFVENERYADTNNIYSLWLAKPFVADKPFLLLDSDILFDPKILTALTSMDGAALAVNRHALGDEEMKVVVNQQGSITQISKTCDPQTALGESVGIEQIDAPYSAALFAELDRMIVDERLDNVFYELAFERLIARNHTFQVVDTTDFFSTELDTVEDFTDAQQRIPPHLF